MVSRSEQVSARLGLEPGHQVRDRRRPVGPGNLGADYVLPSKSLQIRDAGVFWPADSDPLTRLTGTGLFGDPVPSSDHRLVWVDVSHGAFPRD